MSTPRGKIGRLPAAVRLKINLMIRDNKTAASIQKYLKQEKIKDISPQNISSWKKHGYTEWEKRQDRLEQMSVRREFAKELAEKAALEGDSSLTLASNAASALAVDAIQDVLEQFDPNILRDLLADKPGKFVDLVDSLAGLRKGDQAFLKLKMEFDSYRRKVREDIERLREIADKKGGAKKDDIANIFKEAYGV